MKKPLLQTFEGRHGRRLDCGKKPLTVPKGLVPSGQGHRDRFLFGVFLARVKQILYQP
jgi:hypothetical protein